MGYKIHPRKKIETTVALAAPVTNWNPGISGPYIFKAEKSGRVQSELCHGQTPAGAGSAALTSGQDLSVYETKTVPGGSSDLPPSVILFDTVLDVQKDELYFVDYTAGAGGTSNVFWVKFTYI